MKYKSFRISACFSSASAAQMGWARLLLLFSAFSLLSSCFPPNQSGRPWYGESYANTPAYHREKAKHEEQARQRAINSENRATARREYGNRDASPSGFTTTPEVIARARESERRSKEEMDRRAYEAELRARLRNNVTR